jgi:hypothetical protein
MSAATTKNREQPTGRFTYDPKTLCYCGHTLGNHLAEGPVEARDCCEPGCGCHGFVKEVVR